ncbi:MAG: fasciclin domain-containing protein [Thaumarchaeota archaeon]|nr:fasciclin domain-containing protein [Nitrososphaerota archaeon]
MQKTITKDIIDTAADAGSFKTLVEALKAANLVETLKGRGPFTVFAPTDEAFAKLPKGTVEGLLKDIPKLTAILTYHVLQNRVSAKEVLAMTSGGKTPAVETVQGSTVTLRSRGILSKIVYVNDAKVVKLDVEASNGIIHVIDNVILPP